MPANARAGYADDFGGYVDDLDGYANDFGGSIDFAQMDRARVPENQAEAADARRTRGSRGAGAAPAAYAVPAQAAPMPVQNMGRTVEREGFGGAEGDTFDEYRAKYKKTSKLYLIFTIILIVGGFVYELLGRGQWSFHMVYAFVIPLFLGYIPSLAMANSRKPRCVVAPCRWFWHAGVAALSVGCVMLGVMDIFGSGHPLVYVYPAVAAVCLLVSLILSLFRRR